MPGSLQCEQAEGCPGTEIGAAPPARSPRSPREHTGLSRVSGAPETAAKKFVSLLTPSREREGAEGEG